MHMHDYYMISYAYIVINQHIHTKNIVIYRQFVLEAPAKSHPNENPEKQKK